MTPARARSRFLGLTFASHGPDYRRASRASLPTDWAKWFRNEVTELMAQEVQLIPGVDGAANNIHRRVANGFSLKFLQR